MRQLFPTVAAAQLISASTADSYTDRVLAEQGYDDIAGGLVDPGAFAGIASDGRPLDSLLFHPVISTKATLATGAPLDTALKVGANALTNIVATQIADAGRIADAVAVAARPNVGFVRMINPPACSRCAVLAGRFYRFNRGFPRHPRCDCVHIPSLEATSDDLRLDTDRYFASLPRAEQDRLFTPAGAEAIRAGSDIGQVVNARRGMYQANGHTFTREGSTRRGSAGKRLRGTKRLMPESIFAEARDRDHAIELLKRHGYLN